MSAAKHTPTPWRLTDNPGQGLVIHGNVDLGTDDEGGKLRFLYDVSASPSLTVNRDGSVSMHVCYETWRQFPSVDFVAMQKANAELIVTAVNEREALLAVAEAAKAVNDKFQSLDDDAGSNIGDLNDALAALAAVRKGAA